MYRMAATILAVLALATVPGCAAYPYGFRVEVLVDGRAAPQYASYGTRYVEAVRGKEYAIRLHNPLPVRVAVALAVDGLNTIDARRTDIRSAQKWVIDPYQTITITGWQTNMRQARRFYFTSEEQSYAHWLGKDQNIGIVSAVFFRERVPAPAPPIVTPPRPEAQSAPPEAAGREQASPQAKADSANRGMRASQEDEYAATGIGRHVEHAVERIHMDLEDSPAATINIRYEYRAQLVRLGVLPLSPPYPDPLTRRQNARGFEPGFCPEPR